ncbi:MAG: AbrB family transcriptional regulator [Hormoscilla sp. SP12CHS1]|nr:AbrB family transcriptional regulator [Hormoscilla sp. SP12CHS1]
MSEKAKTALTGKALLQKVKELSDKPRRETAKSCGYYTTTKSGQTRVNLTDFYDAVLAAKGVALEPEGSKDGRGREPTYRVSVHKNGQIVIGSTYTEVMGLEKGDEFEIKLGYKHIHLIQIETLENTEKNGSRPAIANNESQPAAETETPEPGTVEAS